MNGPCLCGDPWCGRCFPDPVRAECARCGEDIYKSELGADLRGSENVVSVGNKWAHVECPMRQTDEKEGDRCAPTSK